MIRLAKLALALPAAFALTACSGSPTSGPPSSASPTPAVTTPTSSPSTAADRLIDVAAAAVVRWRRTGAFTPSTVSTWTTRGGYDGRWAACGTDVEHGIVAGAALTPGRTTPRTLAGTYEGSSGKHVSGRSCVRLLRRLDVR